MDDDPNRQHNSCRGETRHKRSHRRHESSRNQSNSHAVEGSKHQMQRYRAVIQ